MASTETKSHPASSGLSGLTLSTSASASDLKLSSFREVLEGTLVSNVIAAATRPMVIIDSTDPPLVGFQKLIDAHIQSAPVRDVANHNKWVGFLDIRDLVSYVILCYEYEEKKMQEEARLHARTEAFHDLPESPGFLRQVLSDEHMIEKATMHRDPRKGISTKYLAVRNRFVPVHPEDNLYKVAQLLASPEIHRVPVVDREGRLVDIISQSNIIKFLAVNGEKLKVGLSQTLTELGFAPKPIVSVLDTDPTLQAFRVMNTRHISGVAIVNSSGVIVGNTSASDLKLFIAKPSFRLLRMSVFQYLNIIRRSSIKEGAPVVSVHAGDTLGKAIAKLSATAMHRIFIVDEHNKPIGVMALQDILQAAVTPAVLPAIPPPSPVVTAAATPANPAAISV